MSYMITEECVSCGACEEECHIDAIISENDEYRIDPEYCTECANCTYVCDANAIEKI